MRWEDERYVRFYTRDTVDFLLLSLEAQGLFGLLLRKVDRAGLLPLGRHGKRAVAVAIGHPTRWSAIERALDELLADGCVQVRGDVLVIPNFIEAQEAPQSEAQRQRESRARARDLAAAGVVTKRDPAVTKRDAAVTKRDGTVTSCHVVSQPVTPSVPSVPSVPSEQQPRAHARVAGTVPPAAAPPPPPLPLPPSAPDATTRWPLSERFRQLLSQGLGGQQNGGKGLAPLERVEERDDLERELAQIDVDAAVAACLEKTRRAGKSVSALSYYRGMVHELSEPARPPPVSEIRPGGGTTLSAFASPGAWKGPRT